MFRGDIRIDSSSKGKEDEDEGIYIVRSSSIMSGSLDQAVELIAASRIEQQQQQQQQQNKMEMETQRKEKALKKKRVRETEIMVPQKA